MLKKDYLNIKDNLIKKSVKVVTYDNETLIGVFKKEDKHNKSIFIGTREILIKDIRCIEPSKVEDIDMEYHIILSSEENKLYDRLKDLGIDYKNILLIIFLLRTHDNEINQIDKMINFLSDVNMDEIDFDEIEKYACLLANDEKYYDEIVGCPNLDGDISFIDCLKLSSVEDSKDPKERCTKCMKCVYHDPKIK